MRDNERGTEREIVCVRDRERERVIQRERVTKRERERDNERERDR